jgi:ATP-dependent RNA helicase RhlE
VSHFEGLGLSAALVRAVAEQGYTQPTPIQAQAIPVVLSGKDLLGAAQTGTGKTAAFALPILQILDGKPKNAVRVLVVTPTRELAAQVEQDFRTYGKHVHLKTACIFGGVGMQPQVDTLRRGVDIVIATPGRLLDHVEQKTVNLSHIEILVLDEADRMLDMGFIHDIRKILALLPKTRQNLLFSATFPDEIRKLAASFMKSPATVEVARRNTPAELVAQVQHPVAQERKRELLIHLVKANDWRQVLVFTRTKHGANRLAKQLNAAGVEADAIHGNKAQNHRTRTLKRFKDNELRVLVATDIAARGLDIEALPHVVNFDLPHVAEDYVHRIGRTGRAGAEGEAVSLVSHEDRPLMKAIEKLMNRSVEERVIAGFEPGTRSQQPAEDRGNRAQSPRQQQQPRHRQPQQQRHGQPKQRHGQHQQHRRPQQQPHYATSAYEDQIREARARLVEEGEPLPPAAATPQPRPNGGNGAGRPDGGQRRRRGGRGRGGRPGQNNQRRGQVRDTRRDAAYSEPRDYPQQHAQPARPVQVTHKPKRTLVGFVGSLFGRKPDPEKS